MRSLYLIFFFLFTLTGAGFALDVDGLNSPESVILDPDTGYYYISNMNGTPLEMDNNGYISRVSSDGLVLVLKFIQAKEEVHELHAPKGLAIVDKTLYVVDIHVVRSYDLETGEPRDMISLEEYEPQFLNDLTADAEGNLYLSDMDGNQIFKIDTKHENQIEVFISGEEMGKPNGLYFDHHSRRLFVATWESGEILEVDHEGTIEVIKSGEKNLDGIFIDHNGDLFVSSFTRGEIYRISERGRGKVRLFQTGLITPADIAYDSKANQVLVPLMMDNRIVSFPITGLEKSRSEDST